MTTVVPQRHPTFLFSPIRKFRCLTLVPTELCYRSNSRYSTEKLRVFSPRDVFFGRRSEDDPPNEEQTASARGLPPLPILHAIKPYEHYYSAHSNTGRTIYLSYYTIISHRTNPISLSLFCNCNGIFFSTHTSLLACLPQEQSTIFRSLSTA